jgi:hypothetical protein
MGARDFYAELGVELPARAGPWVDVCCFAPGHDHDRKPSCGVNLDHGGFYCQACGAKGSAYDAAVLLERAPRDAAALCKRHGLGHWDEGEGGSHPPVQPLNRATPDEDDEQGCTVEQYAEAKKLSAGFLRGMGISDYKDTRWPNRVLRVPYVDADGKEVGVRIRHRLHKGGPAIGSSGARHPSHRSTGSRSFHGFASQGTWC